MRNCLSREGGFLPETALARHRAIGGHSRCPRIDLRQRQFLRQLGAGQKKNISSGVCPLNAGCGIFVLCSLT
jgi:hypothetical protein